MASSNSPSSSHEQTNPLAAKPPAASRRLPPPCWSHDETVALIDAYRGKWYSLQRGNLRAPHWQEVADGVAVRCPLSDPPKTSIQCRHKMEKLRKRYRAEIQRIANTPRGHRYPSSWVHFKQMDAMELGLSSSDPSVDPINQEEDEVDERGDEENEDELFLYPKRIKQAVTLPLNRRYQGLVGNGVTAGKRNGNGVRIRIPNIAAVTPPNTSFDDYPPPVNPHYRPGKRSRDGFVKEAFGGEMNRKHGGGGGMKMRKEMENDESHLMDGMVAAIQKLGDGFLKIEMMKRASERRKKRYRKVSSASSPLSSVELTMVAGRVAHPVLKGPSVVKELIIGSVLGLACGGLWKMHHWNEQRKTRAFYDLLEKGEISVVVEE